MNRLSFIKIPEPLKNPKNTTMIGFMSIGYLLFIPMVHFLQRLDLFEILNALCMAASIGFVIGYAKAFWQAIRMPVHTMTTPHLFICGAFMIHIAAVQVFGLQFIWRINGRPDWLIDSSYAAFTRWQMALGLMVMMATSFSQHGDLMPGTYGRIGLGTAILVFIVAVFLSVMT